MVTKVQIRSQFDLLNELTLRLNEELKEYGFAKAEYYQLPEISSVDENIIPESIAVSKITLAFALGSYGTSKAGDAGSWYSSVRRYAGRWTLSASPS